MLPNPGDRTGSAALCGRIALIVLGIVALAGPAASDPCSLPDLPSCACFREVGPWPLMADMGDLIGAARDMNWTRTSCLKHGGQPYWEIQRLCATGFSAELLAARNPDIQTDGNTKPTAWCTETIAFWGHRANVPYPGGYYTEHHPGRHASSFVDCACAMRIWYEAEEAIDDMPRGRWIEGGELDYFEFIPGVNGPCPGAYQQIYGYDPADGDGNGNVWVDSLGHSQLVDSMVVYRLNGPGGPVQRIDVRMIEGNIGFGVDGFARIINARWYRDIIQFTTCGPDDAVLGNNRKIRGWGINLKADGSTRCDEDRIRTVIMYDVLSYPPPLPAENTDSTIVTHLVNFVATTGGGVDVTTNSTMVLTGGVLPTPTDPWTIQAGPHPVDPVYIDVDLRADHPVPVSGLTLEWLDAMPLYFEVSWAAEGETFQTRPITLPTGAPPIPPGTVIPFPLSFQPDTAYTVRYVRLAFPNWALTETYQIERVHYNYFFDEVEDTNGTSSDYDPPTGARGGDRGPALSIRAAFPNPFGKQARLSFSLPGDGAVRLSVFDVRGRLVKVIIEEPLARGPHEIIWNGRDAQGHDTPSGIYFVRLEWGGTARVTKVVRIK